MSKERKCLTCLTSYRYCSNCGEYSKYPRWMNEFDKESCKELFNAISGYNIGIMKKDDVKQVVDRYEIKDFSVYKESIANKLNELFPKENIKSESVIESVEEVPIVDTVVEEVKTEPSFNHKKNNKNKRNRNVDIDLNENE